MSWVVIDHIAAPSGGELVLSGLSLAAYPVVRGVLSHITVTTDGSSLRMTVSVGGVAVTSYRYSNRYHAASGTAGDTADSSEAYYPLTAIGTGLGIGSAAGECHGAMFEIGAPGVSGIHKIIRHHSCQVFPSGTFGYVMSGGVVESTGVLDGIRIFGSSALLTGQFTLEGLDVS